MKKILALSLTLALVLTMTACGSSAQPAQNARETTAALDAAPETTASETTTPETTAPAERPLSLGQIQDGVYTNEYIGIGMDLSDGWIFAGAEELQQLPEDVKDAFAGSDLAETLESYPTIMDMQAENSELLASINVVYTQMDTASRLAYMLLSQEEIIDGTLAQGDMLIEAYAQSGIEVSSMEKVKITYLGEERWALKTTATTQDIPCFMLQVMDYSLGKFGTTITCSTFLEDHTEEIMGLIYPVEK